MGIIKVYLARGHSSLTLGPARARRSCAGLRSQPWACYGGFCAIPPAPPPHDPLQTPEGGGEGEREARDVLTKKEREARG